MQKTSLITLLILATFFFFGCGETNTSPTGSQSTGLSTIDKVNQIYNRFNKGKFIKQIEKRKNYCTQLVKKIKKHQSALPDPQKLESLYTQTQQSFDHLITRMVDDINNVSNIMSLANIRPNQSYGNYLRNADQLMGEFIAETNQQFNQINKPNYQQANFLATMGTELLLMGLTTAHNAYLDYLKRKLKTKLDAVRFQSWSRI